jgi:hypothetical protein
MNEELLECISPERRWLAKFVILASTEGGNLYDFITEPKHGFQFKKQLHDVINEIVLKFYNEGHIDLYSGEHTRINFIKPIYATFISNLGNVVEKARGYFKKQYSGYSHYHGDPQSISELIGKWRIKYPHLDVELIPMACKAYIDDCKTSDRALKRMGNFILQEKNGVVESDLAMWVDNLTDKNDVQDQTKKDTLI